MNNSDQTSKKVQLARLLMLLAAISAAGAGVSAIANVTDAAAATKVVETWRMLGFFTFAGLFGLLAAKPKAYKGLWEIVILNKLALTAAGLIFARQGHIPGTSDVLTFDGGLTVLLIVAYVLCSGWKTRPQNT